MSVSRSLRLGAVRFGAAAFVLAAGGVDRASLQGGSPSSFPDRPGQLPVGLPAGGGADLIGMARERPGSLNCGFPGPGSPGQVVMAGLTRAVGIETEPVPFRGSADIAMAMRSGRVQVFADAHNIAVRLELRSRCSDASPCRSLRSRS